MAFMSKQFLKSSPQRDRGHWSTKVSIEFIAGSRCLMPKGLGAKMELVASYEDGSRYQTVSLLQEEVNALCRASVALADSAVRREIALNTLRHLDDAELLGFLADLLSRRKNSATTKDG